MILRWLSCCVVALFLTSCAANQAALESNLPDYVTDEQKEAAKRTAAIWNPLADLSVAELEERMNAGDTAAQSELGARYGKGEGVEQNFDKAIELLKDAAAKGEVQADFYLATAYYSGLGVPKNEVHAFMLFEKAADRGHAPSQYWLAVLIKDGRGGIVNPSWDGAVPLLWKSAMQGYPDAEFLLGSAYQLGLGVEQNAEAAAFWYRRTLKRGYNIRADYNLAVLIKSGQVDWRPGDNPLSKLKPEDERRLAAEQSEK